MKRSVSMTLISCILVFAMLLTTCSIAASAADDNKGKYLKDVFIAYGQKKEDAEQWLRDHGWEPFEDLNDGKSSNAKTQAVAVMGIRRTSDPNEAITDIAAMNMKGGYSFDDYEKLVAQKKADITEFINTFVPVLNEYRDNYNGKGSAGGKKRAQIAHDILNKFFDGDPDRDIAINDTGKPLGDLLLNKTKTEIGDGEYNKLSKEEKLNVADLQQIILESTGPAVLVVKQALALATDTSETSWLDRLNGLTGEKLVERIGEFAPEAKGQDLAPSAAMSLLASHFEDYSKILAAQWIGVHENILWYEKYCTDNDLWPAENELVSRKTEEYFNALKEEDSERYFDEYSKFNLVGSYYILLDKISYSGAWGETLYELFKPNDEQADYSEEYSYFAPLAAALSAGQRAALEFISLDTLLKLGMDSESVMETDFPSTDSIFKDKDGNKLESLSIYSGINRAIFRKGVALTNDALTQKSLGNDPYEQLWDEGGMADIISYATFGVGTVSMAVGIGMAVHASKALSGLQGAQGRLNEIETLIANYQNNIANYTAEMNQTMERIVSMPDPPQSLTAIVDSKRQLIELNGKFLYHQESSLEAAQKNVKQFNDMTTMSTAGKWLMGIGGALMILAAILKGVQIYKYYKRTFTKIPTMIVDEADIVEYKTDKNGNQVPTINFVDFAYYEAVKCNRQEIGLHTSAQNGVADYKSWGCGDVADLGADVGKQWLAIYVNRSRLKGDPILADSLKLQKGSSDMPSDCNACLHIFLYKNPVMIDHNEYSFRQDNNGMYLFWKGEETSPLSSSMFNAGYIALSAIGGLAIGILGATAVIIAGKKNKKRKAKTAAQA